MIPNDALPELTLLSTE